MDYLELVIRETLRLFPSVPLIARTNRKSIDISKYYKLFIEYLRMNVIFNSFRWHEGGKADDSYHVSYGNGLQ